MPVFQLSDEIVFPPYYMAEEDGLLAIGGDLSPKRLINAYSNGIFPWYEDGQPILWWATNPRFVLFPEELYISRSMKKILKKEVFEITFNKDFKRVVENCSTIMRPGQRGTWITRKMRSAYIKLHEMGYALSAEAWCDGELAGGLYGVVIGKIFFGESMFSELPNASKAAFITVVEKLRAEKFRLIDCQVYTDHLSSLGAKSIEIDYFIDIVKENI